MTRRIPTRSRISPTLWMLNPEVCTETANLRMAPTTTSTIPNDVRPIPEFLFMAPEHRLTRSNAPSGAPPRSAVGRGMREGPAAKPRSERLCGAVRAHRPDRGHRPGADLRRTTPAVGPGRIPGALQRTTPSSQPPAAPATARPLRRRPLPEADQTPTRPGRPHQRIRAGSVEAQVKTGGRVLEPHRLHTSPAVTSWL